MARLLLAGLILTSALTMAACKKQADTPAAPAATATPAAPAAAAPADPRAVHPFAHAIADLQPGGRCSLDIVDGERPVDHQATAKAGDTVGFGGWVSDGKGQVPLDAQIVLSDAQGQAYARGLVVDVERPDVAKAYGQPGLATAGFNATVTLPVTPGDYDVYIVFGMDPLVACPLKTKLAITQ